MDALKKFSLVAMAALLAAGTAPVFAQDTRPTQTEPERPRVEQGGSDSSRIGEPFFVNPPKRYIDFGFHETLGLTCVTYWWHGSDSNSITFTNNGDKIIPKGTVFTFVIHPGGQTGTWTVYEDLLPGDSLSAKKLTGVDADQLECDVTVKDKVVAEKPAGDKVP